MESCDDHPDNIAVEICRKCDKFICGLHDSSLCSYHVRSSEMTGKPLMVLLSIIGTAVIFFVIGVIISIFDDFNSQPNTGNTNIDVDPVSGTTPTQFPNIITVIMIFFAVAIPLLIFIAVILIHLSNTNIRSIDERSEIDPQTRKYYCQNCGQKLNMSHDRCIKCGKNTDEEKKLIS